MSNSFPKYDDFDKVPKDIFSKEYDTETMAIKIKTSGPENSTINSTLDFWIPTNPKATASFKKPFKSFALEKLELKSNLATVETSLSNVLENLKLEFKADLKNKGDLGATYTIPSIATVTGELDIVSYSSAKASLLTGLGGFTFGGNTQLKKGTPLASSNFSLGLGYTAPNLFVGFRVDQSKKIDSAMWYDVNDKVKVAGLVSYTYPAKPSLQLGATYACHPDTALKIKLGTDGNLGASVTQTIDKMTKITGAATVGVGNIGGYKFGVIAQLG